MGGRGYRADLPFDNAVPSSCTGTVGMGTTPADHSNRLGMNMYEAAMVTPPNNPLGFEGVDSHQTGFIITQ